MFSQIIKWVVRLAPIMYTLEKDVVKTVTVVEADKTLMAKLKDAVDGLVSVLEEVAGVLK